jgi:hypothetical protein
VSLDVDHVFVDPLGAAFPTTKELDQVVARPDRVLCREIAVASARPIAA